MFAPGDSLSHGTLRAEDLVPAFIAAIPDDAKRETFERKLEAIDFLEGDEQEELDYLLEELFDVLQEYAPDGCVFGSHPGDGSDFGFWEAEADA